jgi:hypothetical protein
MNEHQPIRTTRQAEDKLNELDKQLDSILDDYKSGVRSRLATKVMFLDFADEMRSLNEFLESDEADDVVEEVEARERTKAYERAKETVRQYDASKLRAWPL